MAIHHDFDDMYFNGAETYNRGLSLNIGSRYEKAKHKTHNSNHKSQKLDAIGFSVFKIGMKSTVL